MEGAYPCPLYYMPDYFYNDMLEVRESVKLFMDSK